MGTEDGLEYIGSFRFDDNERHSWSVKDMKTIRVNRAAMILKFIILGCHDNKLNIFKQIGNFYLFNEFKLIYRIYEI